jgi:hypothetical protein
MAACIFSLADELRVIAPVPFAVPVSAKPGGGKSEQVFVKKTVYMEFKTPLEDELDDVQTEILQSNTELSRALEDLGKREKDASGDAALLAEIDAERIRLAGGKRTFQTEILARFVVGLPDGHGIGDINGDVAEYSEDLIRRLCQYRFIRTAMYDAFTKLLNGEGKRGN